MTLKQRAQALAQYAAECCQWLHDGTPRHYTDRCEAKMLEAPKDVRNQALGEAEQAIRRAPSLDENGYITEKSAAITAIRALIDTPASEEHDPRDAEIKRLREVVSACGQQFRDYERQHLAKSPPDVTKAKTNADFAERCEAARQTLDRDPTENAPQ